MTRIRSHGHVSRALSALNQHEPAALLDAAPPSGTGIGGRTYLLKVGGERVFVKRIPLTERELRPEHGYSTANVFALPLWYHYGVGSTGGGAWRELGAQGRLPFSVLSTIVCASAVGLWWRLSL